MKHSSCNMMMATPWMPMLMWSRAMAAWCSGSRMGSRGCDSKAERSRCENEAAPQTGSSTKNIVETATASGFFSRLLEALKAAGLVTTLEGAGPFTVFAPTDDAFAKLPAEAVEAAMKDPERLKSILTYHVVPGRIRAADLAGIDSLKTVQGAPLKVDTRMGVRVGSSYVIQADIPALNGVIHVVDSVLLPEAG
jgi:uncharacterized surface protein with fasciclin (FAS1) repeats